jgi:hypothetical protein
MTPPRIALGAVVILALTAACTRPQATPITEPLAPPDTFGPSTTVTTRARTTTTIDIEHASIYPVDPFTLTPLDGFDPLPMGDWYEWYWAAVSTNGSWLAMTVGNDNSDASQLRLIDLDTWEMAGSWAVPMTSPLQVSNNGTVYYTDALSSSNPQLSSLFPGSQQPVIVADLPAGFYPWSNLQIHEDQVIMFGVKSPSVTRYNTGETTIVIANPATGAVTEIPLPMVESGVVAEIDIGEAYPGAVSADPGVAWDREGSKVLIVHATRDVVSEVDLVTGEVSEHQFGTQVWSWGPLFTGTTGQGGGAFVGNRRTAALSRDGRALYVATTLGEFVVGDEDWSATTNSAGIIRIDTETWQIMDSLDAPISEIYLSAAGDRLLATGSTYTEGMDIYEYTSFGFYVVDPVGLEVLAHHESTEQDRYYGAFTFSEDSQLGYVTSWGQQANIDIVDLETGDIIHTRSGGEIQVFGEVGILGEVRQGP